VQPASGLSTPLAYAGLSPPEPGELTRVADGVHWIRLPLPMELDHINLWLLEHDGGFVLVDTGLCSEASRAAWTLLEQRVLHSRPLRLIVITHLHPDHAGLAAWLQARHRVPVWTSIETERQIRQLLEPPTEERIAERRAFFRAHGLADVEALVPSLTGERYRAHLSGVPEISRHPRDSEEVSWDAGTWRWLATGGHAAGHLCLHEPARRLLIVGDQILPTISPNVSLNAWSADTDPLDSYLKSLDRLGALDPSTLVLPSHGRPFTGLSARALQLCEHHRQHLDQLLEACREPRTASDTLRVLFRRQLTGFHQFLAIGEAIAHLEYLATRGLLVRLTEAGGLIRYARRA
jgi:glyoxylase-like metal-dependent hydrolase (beta-lactamase superfamily II)